MDARMVPVILFGKRMQHGLVRTLSNLGYALPMLGSD
jgi:hypothetical protein